jgi:hypothetical protein
MIYKLEDLAIVVPRLARSALYHHTIIAKSEKNAHQNNNNNNNTPVDQYVPTPHHSACRCHAHASTRAPPRSSAADSCQTRSAACLRASTRQTALIALLARLVALASSSILANSRVE